MSDVDFWYDKYQRAQDEVRKLHNKLTRTPLYPDATTAERVEELRKREGVPDFQHFGPEDFIEQHEYSWGKHKDIHLFAGPCIIIRVVD